MCLEPNPDLFLAGMNNTAYGKENNEFGVPGAQELCQFLFCIGSSNRSSLELTNIQNTVSLSLRLEAPPLVCQSSSSLLRCVNNETP